MSEDPNGSRWSKSSNFGKDLMKKSGWNEGDGVGKSKDGQVTHVKVSRKDDVLGLGYTATVQETWSTQSVGFADVLSRIKKSNSKPVGSSDDDEGENVHTQSPTSASAGPTGSKHYNMYAKRNALKTELLRSGSSGDHHRSEILGHGSSKQKRSRDESEVSTQESTLKSPLLIRLTQRYPRHEPQPSIGDTKEKVTITKPNPKPPKCTDTPFLA